jgi:ectoine hydroxylase-related dioxygenase (phytanoyl-CoA dioxygenase family)
MSYNVNPISFTEFCNEALEFYTNHGFVVLKSIFSDSEMSEKESALSSVRMRYSKEMNLSISEYDNHICQWRDLWATESVFNAFLRDERIISNAKKFMGQNSIQLLHDHVIRKPYSALNKTVPWHQDFPFWPVDTPNSLSCWVPMENVDVDGGCLEVIDKSHLWGIFPPVDFIMEPKNFDGRDDIVRISVDAGSIVLLNSLTWHRTNPNFIEGTNRPAYISLWVPSHARYRPDLADWHPMNDHVEVEKGQFLNENWFPRFGERDMLLASEHHEELHDGPQTYTKSMNMFRASPTIAKQIQRIVKQSGDILPLSEYTQNIQIYQTVLTNSIQYGLLKSTDDKWLKSLFDSLSVNSEAFGKHRARNIYNDAYAEWWIGLGSKWVDFWEGEI